MRRPGGTCELVRYGERAESHTHFGRDPLLVRRDRHRLLVLRAVAPQPQLEMGHDMISSYSSPQEIEPQRRTPNFLESFGPQFP